MKKFFVMIALFVIALFAFGQTTDSTAVVTYNFGESLMEFLKANMWTLAFVILYFLSEWIGESETIPEGSVLRKIVNILFGLVKKKAGYFATSVAFSTDYSSLVATSGIKGTTATP